MIIFDGIKTVNKVAFLILVNEQNQRVEIPLEIPIADRISKYVAKIAISHPAVSERGNDEESE